MNEISAFIPKEDSSYPFTCFAQGSFIRLEDEETEYRISFNEDEVLILFFHFKNHRRIYVTLKENSIEKIENKTFWNVDKSRQVLAELRGRNFDRFKMSLDFINDFTEGKCFSFPIAFWAQLVMLCQQNRHSELNLKYLCESYTVFTKYSKKIEKKPATNNLFEVDYGNRLTGNF